MTGDNGEAGAEGQPPPLIFPRLLELKRLLKLARLSAKAFENASLNAFEVLART
jgi:hypothetical protein